MHQLNVNFCMISFSVKLYQLFPLTALYNHLSSTLIIVIKGVNIKTGLNRYISVIKLKAYTHQLSMRPDIFIYLENIGEVPQVENVMELSRRWHECAGDLLMQLEGGLHQGLCHLGRAMNLPLGAFFLIFIILTYILQ